MCKDSCVGCVALPAVLCCAVGLATCGVPSCVALGCEAVWVLDWAAPKNCGASFTVVAGGADDSAGAVRGTFVWPATHKRRLSVSPHFRSHRSERSLVSMRWMIDLRCPLVTCDGGPSRVSRSPSINSFSHMPGCCSPSTAHSCGANCASRPLLAHVRACIGMAPSGWLKCHSVSSRGSCI